MNTEYPETDGIKAIITLQALVGITETREQAAIGWNKMTPDEQAITLSMYELLHTPDTNKDTLK